MVIDYIIIALYNFMWIVIFVSIFPIFLLLSLSRPRWRKGLKERFALNIPDINPDYLFYAPSVGEAKSVLRLVEVLKKDSVNLRIAAASMTPEGLQVLRAQPHLIKWAFLFPLDMIFIAAMWLKKVRPACVVIIEGETWPSFLFLCRIFRVPVVLVAARAGFMRRKTVSIMKVLLRPGAPAVRTVCLADSSSAFYYRKIFPGLRDVITGGTLKLREYSVSVSPPSFLDHVISSTKAVLWVSFHKDEFPVLIRAVQRLKHCFHLIAPRHLHTLRVLLKLLSDNGIDYSLYSSGETKNSKVMVIDKMGVLNTLFPAMAVAVMGGSFSRKGGHNIYEPLFCGVPVVVGPYHWNYEVEVQELARRGCVCIAHSEEAVVTAVDKFLQSGPPCQRDELVEILKTIDGLEVTVDVIRRVHGGESR